MAPWVVSDLTEDYRERLVPLIVPLTLLGHHLNRYPVPDKVPQHVYLHPYPKELMLATALASHCFGFYRFYSDC